MRECVYWVNQAGGQWSADSLSSPPVDCSPLLLLLSLPLSAAASLLSLPSSLHWLLFCSLYVGCDVLIASQLRSVRHSRPIRTSLLLRRSADWPCDCCVLLCAVLYSSGGLYAHC